MKDEYFAPDYAQTIMSYAELCLLKAEVIHLGLGAGSKDAKAYYDDGIRASMAQFGVTDAAAVDAYLVKDGIEYNTYTDVDSPADGAKYYMDYLSLCSSIISEDEEDPIYHQIIMQQYIAMFNQAIDAWTLIRRSQVLDMVPHYQPELGYGAVNAGNSEVEFSYVPQRMMYPSSEIQDNAEEVNKAVSMLEGGDKMDSRLWWAKPQRVNKKLQELVDNYK
jgi:hypothetical protein